MPTDDLTAISTKVRTDEKTLFEQLCEIEGLTPSKAIRSFILACNERGEITKPEIQDAKYIARYNIQQMK